MSNVSSFKDVVAQVKRAYDIADYIRESGVALKRSGSDKSVGLCPFHNEKTPSFNVNDRFQNFRCFGCGANGDLIGFVQRFDNLEFIEALRKLADDKGIELSFDNTDSSVDYRSLRACVRDAANFFYKNFRSLPKSHEAVKEISDRGLSVDGMLYGYAPSGNALYKMLSAKGYSDDLIVEAGVCRKSEKTGRVFDFWQGRLMFYVTDMTGKPIGFSGRKLFDTDTGGKYVNSPETPLFDKSSSLYNVHKAKNSAYDNKIVYVTEGQFDVASFVESGLTNTVASLGTAFTEQQGLICRRLVTEEGRIVFCFDGDKAGVEAAVKVFTNIPSIHSQSYVVNFPADTDPCDFRREHGAEALNSYVAENQKPMVEFILDIIAEKNDLSSPLGVNHYVEQAAKVLKTVSSYTLREVFIKKVALESFTSIETVKKAVSVASPLASGGRAGGSSLEPSESTVARPKLDVDITIDQDELIVKIDEDLTYNAVARLIAAAFTDPVLIPLLLRSRSLFPDDLTWVLEDLTKIPEGVKFFAEDFTYSKVIDHIISSDFFKLAENIVQYDIREQFAYLHNYLRKRRFELEKDSVRVHNYRLLEDSDGAGVEFLAKAIEKEGTVL